MHKKILKYALVLLATASSIFAWTQAESLTMTWRDWYWNPLYAYEWNVNTQYENFDNTATILIDENWNLKTNETTNAIQINNAWWRKSTIMYWNKNKEIERINWRKIIWNSWRCYNTNTVIWNQCWEYNLTTNDILEMKNWNFIKYTLQAWWWITPQAWYSYTQQYLCLYNEYWNSYCTKSWTPEQNNENATIIELCWDEKWCTAWTFTSLYWTSPFNIPTNWNTQINTWKICPMIQFEIDMYWRKYNTWLCYTNSIEFTWWTVQTVQPQSIFEIFNSYTEYVNRYNLWNNNCHAPYTQEHCNNAMSEKRRSIQIFNKIEQAWVDSEKVYQYCHLQLDFTEEQKRTLGTCQIETETNQPYYATWVNGQQSKPNTLEWITNALQNWQIEEEIPIPNTWTVFDRILPEWVVGRKDVLLDYKFYSHFAMLYTKITNLFKARWEQEGIIPPYITSLLLLIILFKIYKK